MAISFRKEKLIDSRAMETELHELPFYLLQLRVGVLAYSNVINGIPLVPMLSGHRVLEYLHQRALVLLEFSHILPARFSFDEAS